MKKAQALKVGDRVEVKVMQDDFNGNGPLVGKYGVVFAAAVGEVGVDFGTAYGKWTGWLKDYKDDHGPQHCWNFYDDADGSISDKLAKVADTVPTIASDLKLTPQAKDVLAHLKRRAHISPAEAERVYGITRLASCIHEIRKRAGYNVKTELKRDDVGHKYANYVLLAA